MTKRPLLASGTVRALALLGTTSLCLSVSPGVPSVAEATEIEVAPGRDGNGSADAPFGRIQDALESARPGDVVIVRPGTYRERVRTVRSGTQDNPITIRATGPRGSSLILADGDVLRIRHDNVTVEGLVLDGAYGQARIVDASGAGIILRALEMRRSSRDCVRVRDGAQVVIEDSLIHRCLNPTNGRKDAHGIVAGAVTTLTVRNTEIHTFSGDAIQLDPGRSSPGWNDVLVEGCRFWLAPLVRPENGFAAGVVPGENAIDTKTWPDGPRSKLTVRDTTARGFQNGLITNMAAFNIKEKVDATLDRVSVSHSQIAFRLRGPTRRGPGSWVRISNAVIHDVDAGVRYEDNIERLQVWNSTFGLGVRKHFQAADSPRSQLDVQNVLILGVRLPPEADSAFNLAVSPDVFEAAGNTDYRLRPGTPPVDAGVRLDAVTTDRDGTARPQGARHDVGAYESRHPVTADNSLARSGLRPLHRKLFHFFGPQSLASTLLRWVGRVDFSLLTSR